MQQTETTFQVQEQLSSVFCHGHGEIHQDTTDYLSGKLIVRKKRMKIKKLSFLYITVFLNHCLITVSLSREHICWAVIISVYTKAALDFLDRTGAKVYPKS